MRAMALRDPQFGGASKHAPAPSSLQVAGVDSPRGESKRVLVIEDDPELRALICAALLDAGYEVLESDHSIDPLDVQQVRPSLAVLDLMLMGEPDGYIWLEA